MTTDLAGRNGPRLAESTFKIICRPTCSTGTGFLHKSGVFVTAAHVVEDCPPSEIAYQGLSLRSIGMARVEIDQALDIALLFPPGPRLTNLPGIEIRPSEIKIGAQVSAWGFPAGYLGSAPLLCSGYISGLDTHQAQGRSINRIIVNAAFNSGNSGGPVVDIATGAVIGLVASKLAPIPAEIECALQALKRTNSGVVFQIRHPDGTMEELVEAQILEKILRYLRGQTQLVLGHAVLAQDLAAFMTNHGLTV